MLVILKERGTGVPPVRTHIAGVCVTSRNVAKVSSDFRHTAGVCVSGRSVAISSSAYRIPNTEVKNPHCRRIRYKSQCGERLSFATGVFLYGWWLGDTLHWRLSCLSFQGR
ncbi:MAG TPA: hypothetical protein VIM51_01935 [Desulfosporosinus sp.]